MNSNVPALAYCTALAASTTVAPSLRRCFSVSAADGAAEGVEREQHAQADADQRAERADHGALHHEDRQDRARRRAERAQDRDVGLLVLDQHDQRRHQVERSDGDQQRQQHEHGANDSVRHTAHGP